jgi:hypothetical protein
MLKFHFSFPSQDVRFRILTSISFPVKIKIYFGLNRQLERFQVAERRNKLANLRQRLVEPKAKPELFCFRVTNENNSRSIQLPR